MSSHGKREEDLSEGEKDQIGIIWSHINNLLSACSISPPAAV